jgi:hypothetical protein
MPMDTAEDHENVSAVFLGLYYFYCYQRTSPVPHIHMHLFKHFVFVHFVYLKNYS